MRDVAQIDGAAVDDAYGDVVQFLDGERIPIEADVVFGAADFRGAGRKDHVLRVDRIHDVGRREPLREELLRVDVHHDLADFSAVRDRHGRALDRGELRTNEVQSEVVQLLLGEPLAAQAQLHDGHRRRVVADDERRRDARGELLQPYLSFGNDL
jgi:hypothetical protein